MARAQLDGPSGLLDHRRADPRHVYHDVLIALDEARGLNNGQPSLAEQRAKEIQP